MVKTDYNFLQVPIGAMDQLGPEMFKPGNEKYSNVFFGMLADGYEVFSVSVDNNYCTFILKKG